jgi:signal transduction histidine kinase
MSDNGRVTIEVSNDGEPLPPELVEKIFVPFATKPRTIGSGLELSVCQQIVHEHGGEICVVNHDDQGSVFRVTLPALCDSTAAR